jgi:predicted aspartyl protease
MLRVSRRLGRSTPDRMDGMMGSGVSLMTVSGPFGQYTTEAVVDASATFSRVPAPALIELGIEPVRTVRLKANGGAVRFGHVGRALVTVEEQEEIVPVLFGEPGTPTIIGGTTLGLLLLELDAVSGRLVSVDAWTGEG